MELIIVLITIIIFGLLDFFRIIKAYNIKWIIIIISSLTFVSLIMNFFIEKNLLGIIINTLLFIVEIKYIFMKKLWNTYLITNVDKKKVYKLIQKNLKDQSLKILKQKSSINLYKDDNDYVSIKSYFLFVKIEFNGWLYKHNENKIRLAFSEIIKESYRFSILGFFTLIYGIISLLLVL